MRRTLSSLVLAGLLLAPAALPISAPVALAQEETDAAAQPPLENDGPDVVLDDSQPSAPTDTTAPALPIQPPAPVAPIVPAPAPAAPAPVLPPAQATPTPVVVYPTRNGSRTEAQIREELTQAGYGGPWDLSSVLAAYDRATAPTPTPQPTAVPAAPPAASSTPVPLSQQRTPFGSTVEEACRHLAEDFASIPKAYGPGGNGKLTIHEDSFFCPSQPSSSASLPSAGVVTVDTQFPAGRAMLTRVAQDLYRDSMTGNYVRTLGCPLPALGEEAIITSDRVIFTFQANSCERRLG